jgi:hypothetical protein
MFVAFAWKPIRHGQLSRTLPRGTLRERSHSTARFRP